MENLPARTGWTWVRQGFALFMRQPAEMLTTFLAYLLLMFGIGLIQVVGQIFWMLILPILSIGFMQACANIEQGKRVFPSVLLTGFRSSARTNLLKLGGLYMLTLLLVLGTAILVDDGTLWKVLNNQVELNRKTMDESNIMLPMLLSIILYLPAAMAFWYAAALVQWKKMSLGKAIFYSFFAVWRAKLAFLVYGLAWLVIGVILPAMLSRLIQSLSSDVTLASVLLLPISIILSVIFYCSFYATYKTLFGAIEEELPPATGPGSDADAGPDLQA
jgi:hypothetical protein